MKLALKQLILSLSAVYLASGASGLGLTAAFADDGDLVAKMVKKTVRDPVTQESISECTVRTPDLRSPLGLSKEQLSQFAQMSENDQALVQWYVGGSEKYNQLFNAAPGSPDAAIRREANWARCESMAKFVSALNRDFFKEKVTASSMVCKGAPYTYSFHAVDGHVQMDIVWATEARVAPARPTPGAIGLTIPGSSRSITHERVQIVETGDSTCPLRVTQSSPNSKKIRMCLPVSPHNDAGEGSVSMHIAGRDLPVDQQQIACQADESFMKIAIHGSAKVQRASLVSEVSSGTSVSR